MRPAPPCSRDRILQRIRRANAQSAAQPPIPRDYDRISGRTPAETLAHFEERLRDYDARLFTANRGDIAIVIAEILIAANRHRIAIPTGLPTEWRDDSIEWTPDDNLSVDALNSVDGVMTAATVCVAASGSIALQHGPAEGRRSLTLLPDYHLCIVEASQVVETLPEAFARLDPFRPVTFISGPSATADIEMTRIKGVHGPRFLDVLLIEN
jgi:L-lactate dehydrogenase complex protein LldG